MNMSDLTTLDPAPVQVGTTGKVIDPTGVQVARHYNNHPSGVEVKRVTNFTTFNLGSAFKYVLRRGDKIEHGLTINQSIRKDLQKALWYLREQQAVGKPPVMLFTATAESDLLLMIAAEPDLHVVQFMNQFRRFCTCGIPTAMEQMLKEVTLLHDSVPQV